MDVKIVRCIDNKGFWPLREMEVGKFYCVEIHFYVSGTVGAFIDGLPEMKFGGLDAFHLFFVF